MVGAEIMEFDWQKYTFRAYDWLIVHLPRIALAFIFLLVGLWLVHKLGIWLKARLVKKYFNSSVRYFLENFVLVSLKILLFVFTLQIAGIRLTFVTAIFTGLTVAAGLALSGTLQNFVSGLLILLLHPFRIGDFIVTQGQEGKVTSIQLFSTVVLTLDNKTIIIPNGQLSNNVVVNLSRQGQRRLDIEMKFNYNIETAAIREILSRSLDQMDDILKDPVYKIGISALETDKFAVQVKLWVTANDFEDIKFRVHERIMNDLKANGIKFPGMT